MEFIERADAVKRLKAALKKKTGKTWSVHGDKARRGVG